MSTKYILGVDLDNCVVNYTDALKNYMMNVNPSFTENDFPAPVSYNFADSGWPFNNIEEFIETHNAAVREGMFRAARPMENVAEEIDRLRSEGVHIRIVTHRIFSFDDKEQAIIDTIMWLKSHKVNFDSICFDGDKGDIVCDGFVDDAPSNIESIRMSNSAYCFAFNQSYNKDIDGPRVYNWKDAVEKVLEHKKKIGK